MEDHGEWVIVSQSTYLFVLFFYAAVKGYGELFHMFHLDV